LAATTALITKRQFPKGVSGVKRHLSVITVIALVATPAMGDALTRAALTAQKCSHQFIISSVSQGDYRASLDIADASLEYCTAAWQEVAVLEFPGLAQGDALGRVKQIAREPLKFDVFTAKDHL
jgi:hypothetical protein